MSDAEVLELLAVDRREVPEKLLSSYASSALLTMGSVDDYLYFLPAILETEATGETWLLDLEITGSRIKTVSETGWPPHLRSAVEAFYLAWLRSVAGNTGGDEGAQSEQTIALDSLICGTNRSSSGLRNLTSPNF